MSRQITKHGIRWINDDCGVYCSECNTADVSWEITWDSDKYVRPNVKIWKAKCKCNRCHCEWILTREESIREEC